MKAGGGADGVRQARPALPTCPAYYADIRGGRPIRAGAARRPRRALPRAGDRRGDEPSPLNLVTEETRAALERTLGVPVFTGMRHWEPRIAPPSTRLSRRVPTRWSVSCWRRTGRRCRSRSTRRCSTRPSRASRVAVRARVGDRAGLHRAAGAARSRCARQVRGARCLHRALPARAHPRSAATPTGTSCSRRHGWSPSRRQSATSGRSRSRASRDGGAVARAGHPRPPRRAAGAGRQRRARLPGRVRLRSPRDPLGHRRRGRRAGARARAAVRADRDAERRSGVHRRARGHRPRASSRLVRQS